MREDSYLEKIGKYNHARFSCRVGNPFLISPYDEEGYKLIQEALKAVGIDMHCEGGNLSMQMDAETYVNAVTRLAGPRPKNIKTPSKQDNKGYTVYYSDIITMMQTMSDKEIMKELAIPKATFYRHKKVMLGSIYYEELDKSKLDDPIYLKSAMFDEKF